MNVLWPRIIMAKNDKKHLKHFNYDSVAKSGIKAQWTHDIRNVYVTFYKRYRNIPMSNVRKMFQKRSKNVFRTLDIGMFLERL